MAQSKNVRKIFGEVEVTGNQHVGDAGDGFDIKFDGTNTLNIDPANANDVVRIGETNQADLQVDGATDLLWDASAGSLTNGGMLGLYAPDAAIETIAAGNPGALSVATVISDVSVDAGGDAFTLADGTVVGQIKVITLVATAGGTAVVTPANYADGTTMTLSAASEHCVLMWNGSNWRTILNVGGVIA